MNKLVLTGFMGTGKTTIARLITEKTNIPLIDTDTIITERTGKSIPQLFSEQGEAAFRAWEAAIAAELGADDVEAIVSTGGGLLLKTDNQRALAADTIVCLKATPQTIFSRLQNDDDERPLLQVDDPLAKIEELLNQRKMQYRRFRWQVDTTDRDPDDIADEIIAIWRRTQAVRAHEMRVQTPDGFYPILEQHGAIKNLAEILDVYGLNAQKLVIGTDDNVGRLLGDVLCEQLPNAQIVMMRAGETAKNLATVSEIYGEFARLGVDRNTVIIALGGGVVGDTFGYAAATYLRGLRFVQMPTSLLAMVDSSVGGKVGVDVPMGKNLVGAFKQPDLVIIDPATLTTLPVEETRAGMAEVIKHGLLANKPELLGNLNAVAEKIRTAVQVKIDVVQRDPFEQAERAYLNLGHTFGHAIERVSMYQWRHGDAVAVGLVAAARLSEKLGLLEAAIAEQIEVIVAEAGLPTSYRNLDPHAIWEAMHTDKKWRDGRSYFVVLHGLGQPNSVRDVSKDDVIDILEGLRDA